MDRASARAPAEDAASSPAPWIDPTIQSAIEWRDGDIVISVPVKSGTTWTMNIVHQLREAGDADLEDVYLEVPWIELRPSPSIERAEIVAALDAMPRSRRRAFKTHAPPGPLPFHARGSGKDVKYVVVIRNPDEAVASFLPFIAAHSNAWFELWGVPREAFVRPDFGSYFEEIVKPVLGRMLFGFVAAWWPLRGEPNVLLIHYSDMKRDHEGAVRKIGRFLGFDPPADRWPLILEYTSFEWMKANEEKFEIRKAAQVPVLEKGAMVRKGKVGAAREDGVTEAISAEIAAIGRAIVRDETAFEWCYRGGPLPR